MILTGYYIMAFATIISVVALARGRERTIVFSLGYFLSYEFMAWGLRSIGQYEVIPYMSLAVAIDFFFFYKFLDRKAVLSYLAVATSAFYGGITVLQCAVSNYWFYSVYEYVNIAISLVILLDGAHRAYRFKHHADRDGDGLLSRLINRLIPHRKG